MRRIFIEQSEEDAISQKGYVIMRDLIPKKVCDDLNDFFQQNDRVDNRAFTISNWNNNLEHRDIVFNQIVGAVMPFTSKILEDYNPVMGVFAIKRSGAESDMLLHQDWTLVDEKKFHSVSVWVALCDMDYHNGNLQVAEGSHIYAGFPRGMNVPVSFENIRRRIQEKYLTDLPLKKGDAVVFDHRLIHASPANNSGKIRLAAVMALIPADAELVHYYKYPANDHELEVLKMAPEEFHGVDFFDMPNKPKHISSLGMVPAVFRQITIEEIKQQSV